MATNKLQWKRIAKGNRLPCQSFLRKKDGEILKLSTCAGVEVGQDAYYLPVDEVINVIKDYPVEVNEDEEIRKELLLDIPKVFPHDKAFRYITYLEKQGERKHQYKSRPRYVGEGELLGKKTSNKNPADKVEPKYAEIVRTKFKDGDWVVYQNETFQVRSLSNGSLILQGEKYQTYFIAELCRPWTIRDAKDGDVVFDKSDGVIGIFKSIGHHPDGGSCNDPSYCLLHCRYDNGFFYADFENGNESDSDDIIPATKEQREQLEKAMADAGYTFDFEKKELKKIVDGEQIKKNLQDNSFRRMFEQKPVEWSDEDEEMIENIIDTINMSIEDCDVDDVGTKARFTLEKERDWLKNKLKSLRPQSTWRPSEEMLDALYRVIPENTMEISEDKMLLDKLYQGLKYGKVLSEK